MIKYFSKIGLLALMVVFAVGGVFVYNALAAVTSVTITSPTGDAPVYIQTGGTFQAEFNVTTTAIGVGKIRIEVLKDATSIADTTYDYNFTVNGTNNVTSQVLISGVAPEGSYNLKVSAQQPGGGTWFSDTKANAVRVDNTAPTGYTVSIDQPYINDSNKGALSFTFAGAEVGAVYTYSITDSVTTVTATGTITTATDTISGINVTGLDDGTLTLTVYLTDPAGNQGASTTATVTKDVVAPTVTAGNISISGASGASGEYIIGDTVTAVWDNSGAGSGDNNTDILSVTVNFTEFGGAATVTATQASGKWTAIYTVATGTINGVADKNVFVTATDNAGNITTTEDNTNATVDNQAPAGYTVSIDQPYINDSNKGALSFTFAGAEVGAVYTYSITDSVTTVTATGTITTATDTISGINVTGLDDGTLTLTVYLTDPAGNQGASTTATVTKDVVIPTIQSIVGTSIQDDPDQIAIAFSEPVTASSTWENILTITNGSTTLDLANANFNMAENVLTITLDEVAETRNTYLVKGFAVSVTPTASEISDEAGNYVATTEITGANVTGDPYNPVATLTYNPNRAVTQFETLVVTAEFNEAVSEVAVPTIAIVTQGDGDLSVTNMTRASNTAWTYSWQVPGGADDHGNATVTIVATDLAGNTNTTVNNTFTIDPLETNVTSATFGTITTSSTVLTVTTNKNSTCKYATTNADYAGMTAMSTTGAKSHSQSLTGLTAGTRYDYYVRCSDAQGNISPSAHVYFTTLPGDGSLSVTSIQPIKTYATADNTYGNGWSWKFLVTVPTAETQFKMKFADWISGSNTIAVANNMKYSTEQATNTDPVSITAAGTYPDAITLNSDLDANKAGRQIEVLVEMKIPAGSTGGSYSTSYGVFSDSIQ